MTEPRPPDETDAAARERAAADEALARHRQALRERFPMPQASARRTPARIKQAAGTSAMLLVLTAGLLWLDPAYRREHYATAIGEHRRMALRDGSTVTLDTGSGLDVSWHLRSRRATLTRGQAFFDVAHTAWRPFRVEAGDARIRVVGTAFNVREDTPAATAVTVLRGHVAVRGAADGRAGLLLGAGERAVVRGGRVAADGRVDAQRGMPWTDGRLVFDRTPLREALAEIARYRRAPLTLAAPQLGELRLSGVFSVERSDDLLDLLPRILPVRVERAADGGARIVSAPAAAPARPPRLMSTAG
ncbi:FecR family protein [Solimonas soli]|uniref:FecR family protein n=1 Tax=Solimonas soli TaxID=413479 RepID=UPI0004ADC955|nr:FecR domain-containing protein [Solimonas soli]